MNKSLFINFLGKCLFVFCLLFLFLFCFFNGPKWTALSWSFVTHSLSSLPYFPNNIPVAPFSPFDSFPCHFSFLHYSLSHFLYSLPLSFLLLLISLFPLFPFSSPPKFSFISSHFLPCFPFHFSPPPFNFQFSFPVLPFSFYVVFSIFSFPFSCFLSPSHILRPLSFPSPFPFPFSLSFQLISSPLLHQLD